MENDAVRRFVRDHAGLVHLVLDRRDARVLEANRHALESLGASLPGRRFNELLVEFIAGFDLEDALREPGSPRLLNLAWGDGMPRSLLFHFVAEGDVAHAFGEVDAGELETLGRVLRESTSELSARTRELEKANAELKRLGDLKNRFLGMAAHDMRGPLGAIQGFSQFLKEEACLSGEQHELLEIIERSSGFMLSLIDDLLDVSRIEAGRLGLVREPTDLAALMKRSVSLHQVLAKRKDIVIEGHLDELPPGPVSVDPGKVEQVLGNLLSNAVKYAPNGSTVSVELFMSGHLPTVAVADQGPGVPDEALQRIFEPFATGPARPTGDEGSTGLGLHIVRRIVLAHGGKVWVENRPGAGACFYFTLDPRSQEQPRPSPGPDPGANPEPEDNP